eukprot:169164_1
MILIMLKKSKLFLSIIIQQGLSGEKLISLGDLRTVVLEKALLKHMTESSFAKMIQYLEQEIKVDSSDFEDTEEQDIAEFFVDCLLNILCEEIRQNNINGAKISENNDLFVSWLEMCTGWGKTEIFQLNSILLNYKSKKSRDIQLDILHKLTDHFDKNIATFVSDEIQKNNLDLSVLQLKIRKMHDIEQEREILLNLTQNLENRIKEQYTDRATTYLDNNNAYFIPDIYNIFAQSLQPDIGWICFNCSHLNCDANICNLCGIKILTSTIYAIKGIESFAFVLLDTNTKFKSAEEDQETDNIEINNKLNLKCPKSTNESVCCAIRRLAKHLIFYQSWIHGVTLNNGNNNIELTTNVDMTILDNDIFQEIFVLALEQSKKIDLEMKMQIEEILKNDIINIDLFRTMDKTSFLKLMTSNTTLKLGICSQIHRNASKLLKSEAHTKQFGKFFDEIEIETVIKDYHHILQTHISNGDKIAKESVFRFFQENVKFEFHCGNNCSSLLRNTKRQLELNKNADMNNMIDNDKESDANNNNVDIWSKQQYYAQSTLDLIHSYFVHHDWVSDIHMIDDSDDEKKCKHLNVLTEANNEQQFIEMVSIQHISKKNEKLNNLREMNQQKYVTNVNDNNPIQQYRFGIDHDYIHLKSKFK